MPATYSEQDCTITHEGRTFEAGGAVVTDHTIVAYLGDNNVLTDWHGNAIGVYRITASWRQPVRYGDVMHQVRARVNGQAYTGRSRGVGMIYKGKATK